MADKRTMAQLLQAPTEGYEDAIVVPAITANNFELKHGLLTLVQNKQFFGHDKEDPHAYIRYFNNITCTLKFPNVPNTFKDLLRACPHHGFSELHQLDTFYNALNSKDQDSLNSASGVVAKVSMNTSTSGISPDVAELKDMVKALPLDKKSQNQAPAYQAPVTVKAVEESCVTCGGAHSYRNCPATDGNVYRDNIQEFISQASAVNYNQGNTTYRPPMMLNQIRPPGFPPVSYDGPQIIPPPSFLPKVVKNKPEATKDTVNPTNNESTEDVQPSVVQSESLILTSELVNSPIIEPVASPVSASRPNQRPSIPYPARLQDQKLCDKANDQREKFFQIFKDLNFNISFTDALILMPKFGPSIKSLLTNKDKLCELARTPLNEHCSAVLLKKLPEKLGDPGKFLIPCDFFEMAGCLAFADFGASINLMPLFVWNKLYFPNSSPTCMTLKLADRSISRPIGVAEDVYIKVGTFHFQVDFVVVDFDVDPRAITFNLDLTSRYSSDYNDITAKRIDVIGMACEEYSQKVLGYSDLIVSGNPTPYYDPIVSTTSPTLTPFENSDFLLEEVDAFLVLEDDPTSSKVDQSYLDSEGDILLLEAFLNDDPSLPPPNQGNYLPEVRKELKICETKSKKSSIDEPPEVELKDLPPHLEYAFLKGDDKLPVIIVKDLKMEEKIALITVLKLLDAGLIYPISDSPWVSPVHYVPKKGGFTVVENEDNELILTRLVTGWRVCIDYRKLNEAIRKDHFPLPFMDQMLERLTGNQYYCFLDGFYGYFQIPIDSKDQEKTTFTWLYETFAYRRMPFGLCNAPGTFQRCMMAIFHDMIEKTIEVFMDDFSIFRNSFQSCLFHLERMLKKCEDTNLCLNWEKSHFMVKEGIVLGHKISKQGIEVDKAKWMSLPNYLIQQLSRADDPTSRKRYPFIFSKECVEAFQTLKRKLSEAPILIAPDWDMPSELMCDASDFAVGAVLGQRQEKHFRPIHYARAENLAADHLSRLENSHQNVLDPKEINESFPLETLNLVSTRVAKVMQKFGVSHRLATPYHPQASGQVEALKHANFDLRTAGDHRKVQLNELLDQAYEKSLIYKEKTKRLHDSKIKDRVFNIGNRVLLFNSRLKIFFGKLKSRWFGPFIISHVYPYGTVELSQPDGPNFKVNGHRMKHYFGEDIPKLVVIDLQTFPKDH
nr:reverse transcriptase domain-containing protein [Tanacetum cinerariifolium]